ncbi:hypothetical protein ACIQ1J_03765 [Streptomyces sp. NPDC097107]|uniref:hypothetical protein n=1 Tax=unclassified Streptomyces TaxID=2593676 RepID=UPI001B35CC0F|nr:hypothetical protein [Streptomyces sp. b94]MBQ1098544.1 hypothetical protein [Streptomyces sp. b94]
MSRREPGERYFERLREGRREAQRGREAAERAYSRDVAVARVISMIPPLLFCAAMVAGAASEGVATAVLRYVLGPAALVATGFLVRLVVKYARSPQRDSSVPVVVFGGALLNCLTGFATGSLAYVLFPLAAPLTQWVLPRVHTLRKGNRD